MTKKLTTESINERLKTKGFTMIGKYVNSKISVEIECSSGHRYSTRISNIINNRNDGCSMCSNHSSKSMYTTKNINQLLEHRKISLIEEFKTVNDKLKFSCKLNHTWTTTVGSVIGGSGCPHCYGNIKWTKSEIDEIIIPMGLELINEFCDVNVKTMFKCRNNHIWETQPRVIINNRSGCPSCAEYGFKPNKKAWLYVIKFNKFLKYGITNNLNERLAKHKRSNGEHSIVITKLFENGQEAYSTEKIIKTLYGGSYVNKHQCPDGYTETLNLSMESELVNFVRFSNEI